MNNVTLILGLAALSSPITPSHAAAAGSFDPSDYLIHQEFENGKAAETIQHGLVVKDGVVYRRIETSAGSILLPKGDDLRPEDLDRAACATGDEASETPSATISAVEASVGSKIRLYSSLILEAVARKCDGRSLLRAE